MEIIQEFGTIFFVLAIVFGLYMTWGIGANDVANVMGTSVGSGAITVMTAIIIAAIFEFAGAALAGGHVTDTIRKGIIDPEPIANNPEILVLGMLAALLAAATWLMIASTTLHWAMLVAQFFIIQVFNFNPRVSWLAFVAMILLIAVVFTLRLRGNRWRDPEALERVMAE